MSRYENVKCFEHRETCTQLCVHKDCVKKLLCDKCVLKHDVTHLPQVHSLKDTESSMKRIPVLIEKDLESLKSKLFQMQNHCALEKENMKKLMYGALNKIIDEFMNEAAADINRYYAAQEEQFGTILSVIHDHLKTVLPYTTPNRPVSQDQFALMMDFQEQMLANVMPALNKKAQVLHDRILNNPLQMKTDHFHALVLTYLKKGLQTTNLFAKQEKQQQSDDVSKSKSALFSTEHNHQPPSEPDIDINVYRTQARELLKNHYREEKSLKEPQRFDYYGIKHQPSSQPAIKQISFEHYKDFGIQINNVLSGHSDIVTSVCVLSTTKIASSSGDGAIKIWDVDSAINVGTLTGHVGDVWQLIPLKKQHEPCTHFASCGSDKTVRIWSIDKRTCSTQFVGHMDVIRTICYIPDLDYIVSAGKDRMIKVWNVGRERQQATIEDAHKLMIKCFCYVEAKGLLLSGSADRTIKVWNVLTLNNRDVLTGHRGEVCCLVHMQDSLLNDSVTLVASGGTDQKVIIWNLDLAQIVKQLHGHMDTVTALAYNLEKMHLWSVGADRTVRIWDWFNSKQLKSLKRHGDLISDIKLIKQRELVVTASWDHKIRVTGYEYYYLANN